MNIKKLILILGIAMVALTSCKKDDIKPNMGQFEDCNCGTVTQIMQINIVDISNISDGGVSYRTTIKNWCSNNMKEYEILRTSNQPQVYIGDIICFSKPW